MTRIVVTGATGNVGTSVLRALREDPSVDEIVGVARRMPDEEHPKTEWVSADVTRSNLRPIFRGADAVIHLAWLIQPSRNRRKTRAVNVDGSERVFRAVAEEQVPALVHASSIAAYAPALPGSPDPVDERWPIAGVPSSFYATEKALAEEALDRFERQHPEVRVVRLRPSLIFKRSAAAEIRRLFAGPLLPGTLLRPGRLPAVPYPRGLEFQLVHSDDVGEAYRAAALGDASGAFNIAADPIIDAARVEQILKARVVPLPGKAVRGAMVVSHKLHLQPSEPGWLDLGFAAPTMDCSRAAAELGWVPERSATDALEDLLEGLADNAGGTTPPLKPSAGGPLRLREFLTGVGSR